MAYSVYIAKPPSGGGYPADVYKIGRTTETNVEDRISGLNDGDTNYRTINDENWELYQKFEFQNEEQMEAFEAAMMEHLNAGIDPHATGATELFRSSDLDEDVAQAVQVSFRDLVEAGYVDPTQIANLAEANGMAPPGSATEIADFVDLSAEAINEVLDETSRWLVELVLAGIPIAGFGITIWRVKRITKWIKRLYGKSQVAAKKRKISREPEPDKVAAARAAFEAAKR